MGQDNTMSDDHDSVFSCCMAQELDQVLIDEMIGANFHGVFRLDILEARVIAMSLEVGFLAAFVRVLGSLVEDFTLIKAEVLLSQVKKLGYPRGLEA